MLELGVYALEDIKDKRDREREQNQSVLENSRIQSPGLSDGRPQSTRSRNYGDHGQPLDIQMLLRGVNDDKKKWDILSKELAQKQELIHRVIRESDDKTESLKITVIKEIIFEY